ncbi:hypothetical protein AKH17_03105, partial [Pelagibacteraceae bacterium GOM-A2]
ELHKIFPNEIKLKKIVTTGDQKQDQRLSDIGGKGLFAVIGSKFIMENIFELVWQFDFKVLIYLGASIGIVTLILIMLTNLKYLSPKVYPLIRNQ